MNRNEIAILMAAGLGTRMRPITDHIPKPLVKVTGTPLIETIINELENRGVEKIYIVTGYLGERFEYLKDKFSNITLVKNNEYLEKNNISSIAAVSDVLGEKDCFICEADLFVPRTGLLKENHEKSGYYGKFVPGKSNDWVFDVKENRITGVHKFGENCFNMVGVSYWKAKDAVIIRDKVLELANTPSGAQLFWDEAVDRCLDEIDAMVYEVQEDEIIEVDTVQELVDLEKNLKGKV